MSSAKCAKPEKHMLPGDVREWKQFISVERGTIAGGLQQSRAELTRTSRLLLTVN
jgi:hypothetical protein